MPSNSNLGQITNAGESLIQQKSSESLLKKTAFDWNLFDNRADVLRDLRQKREFVDLMLVTEDGGEEYSHFAVVSTLGKEFTEYIDKEFNSADVVEEVLSNGFVVKKVVLKNTNKSVLKIIVDYSYSGSVETNNDNIWQLIETAELYELKDVLELSLNHFILNLNRDNCVQVFNLGHKHRHKLSNAAYAFIRTHFTEIVEKCIDFPNLTFDALTTLLVDDELNVGTEKTAFNAIICWIKFDITSRKDNLLSLLSKLRFARIELSFIENNIANNQLICEDKLCKYLVNQFKEEYKTFTRKKDGNKLYVGLTPEAIRPRIPHEIMLAFGGWQEGVPTTLLEAYDIRTNLWFDTKLSNDFPRAYHGIEAIDGMIYVIGGTNGTEILNSVQCFNPITKKWFQRSSMIEQRCYVSTAVIHGIIYAMGGHNGRQRVKSCEKYDKTSDRWTKIEDMNVHRSDASATVHMNKIYIAGGLNDQMIENTVEVYDPNDKTWNFIQPMTNPRTSLGFVCFNESLYAIGGNNGFERLQSVERYDFKLKSWLPVADMKSKRSTFSTAIIDDRLFVIGGYNGQTPICSVEKYDDKQKVWSEVRPLKHDRSGLAVCVVRGLSNNIEYTYIGQNSKKANKRIKLNKIIETKNETMDEEMEID